MTIEALKPKHRIVFEGRHYTVTSAKTEVEGRQAMVYVETTVGTMISGRPGTFVETY
jgi:hypothetical protein